MPVKRKSKAAEARSAVRGHWRVESTSLWDDEALHLLGLPYLKLRANGLGDLQVGALEADIDWQVRVMGDLPVVDFTFEGSDDGTPVCGRGSMNIEGDHLQGQLFIHRGETSTIIARRLSRR